MPLPHLSSIPDAKVTIGDVEGDAQFYGIVPNEEGNQNVPFKFVLLREGQTLEDVEAVVCDQNGDGLLEDDEGAVRYASGVEDTLSFKDGQIERSTSWATLPFELAARIAAQVQNWRTGEPLMIYGELSVEELKKQNPNFFNSLPDGTTLP